jgi:hypothetical protein
MGRTYSRHCRVGRPSWLWSKRDRFGGIGDLEEEYRGVSVKTVVFVATRRI